MNKQTGIILKDFKIYDLTIFWLHIPLAYGYTLEIKRAATKS